MKGSDARRESGCALSQERGALPQELGPDPAFLEGADPLRNRWTLRCVVVVVVVVAAQATSTFKSWCAL